jgi:hypothetical protein
MAITNDKGETLFAVRWDAGMCGTEAIEGVWAVTGTEAIEQCIPGAWDHFYSYNHEEEEEEDIDPELDIWAEVWDDEVHPQEWPGETKYAKDFI